MRVVDPPEGVTGALSVQVLAPTVHDKACAGQVEAVAQVAPACGEVAHAPAASQEKLADPRVGPTESDVRALVVEAACEAKFAEHVSAPMVQLNVCGGQTIGAAFAVQDADVPPNSPLQFQLQGPAPLRAAERVPAAQRPAAVAFAAEV